MFPVEIAKKWHAKKKKKSSAHFYTFSPSISSFPPPFSEFPFFSSPFSLFSLASLLPFLLFPSPFLFSSFPLSFQNFPHTFHSLTSPTPSYATACKCNYTGLYYHELDCQNWLESVNYTIHYATSLLVPMTVFVSLIFELFYSQTRHMQLKIHRQFLYHTSV